MSIAGALPPGGLTAVTVQEARLGAEGPGPEPGVAGLTLSSDMACALLRRGFWSWDSPLLRHGLCPIGVGFLVPGFPSAQILPVPHWGGGSGSEGQV